MDMGMDMAMPGMGGGGVEMGDMEMGKGVPTAYELQRRYWAVIGAVLALATILNLFSKLLCKQRRMAARNGSSTPAKPDNVIALFMATCTAIIRELTYYTLPAPYLQGLGIQMPTLGSIMLASAQLVLVLSLSFDRIDPTTPVNWENTAYRVGYISTAQLPLIYVLSGKHNFIGFLTSMGYEKLNWLHRWTARVLFVTVTMHMVLWFENWAQYDYIMVKLRTESVTQRGFAAWVLLLWIVVSSSRPFRGLSYESFVAQHVITLSGFSAAVYLHLPADMKYVLWVSVAFAIFDRLARSLNFVRLNLSLSSLRRCDWSVGYLAQTERLPGGVSKVTIERPRFSWSAGQHVFVACQSIAPLQSHPFTISSLSTDERLTFLVKARHGASQKMHTNASDHLSAATGYFPTEQYKVMTLQGPYGRIRPLDQFDSVIFLAGSVGASFTVPLMRDLVRTLVSVPSGCAIKHVRFVWIIKSLAHLCWFAEDINDAARFVESTYRNHPLELDIGVYVTCENQGNTQYGIAENHRSLITGRTDHNEDTVSGTEKSAERLRITSKIQQEVGVDKKTGNGVQSSEFDNLVTETNTENSTSASSKPTLITRTSSSEKTKKPNSQCSVQQTTLHPSISLIHGRPEVRSIIRQSLEQARGESAVVTCGPGGLIADVRASVVGLSDERAVHKGTGAQGIYLHTEPFCF